MPSKPTPRNSRRYKKSHTYKEPNGHKWADGGVLNIKQEKAIDEYFKNGGMQEQALLAAGYSANTAKGCPHSVFSHPAVVREMERRRQVMTEMAEIDEAWVLKRLALMANAPRILARYRKVNKADGSLSYDFRGATEAELSVITDMTVDYYVEGKGDDAREVKKFKIGIVDPKGALDSIARVLGLNKDKVSHEVEISLVERLHAGRKRVAMIEGEKVDG